MQNSASRVIETMTEDAEFRGEIFISERLGAPVSAYSHMADIGRVSSMTSLFGFRLAADENWDTDSLLSFMA
ncbi:MAG: hypothetical protein AAB175_02350, partial [Nitrospirota bacterium]